MKGWPEVGTAEWAGPSFLGPAGFVLAQHNFLCDISLLVGHHPVVVRRVAHLACA